LNSPGGTAEAKAPLAMPKNAATGRFYSGINVLILWDSVIKCAFQAIVITDSSRS
jgi:antirestriction protein ArdC